MWTYLQIFSRTVYDFWNLYCKKERKKSSLSRKYFLNLSLVLSQGLEPHIKYHIVMSLMFLFFFPCFSHRCTLLLIRRTATRLLARTTKSTTTAASQRSKVLSRTRPPATSTPRFMTSTLNLMSPRQAKSPQWTAQIPATNQSASQRLVALMTITEPGTANQSLTTKAWESWVSVEKCPVFELTASASRLTVALWSSCLGCL